MSNEQPATPTPAAELSFEQARAELDQVVAALERGSLGLEASLDAWERGEELAAVCATWLDGARARIDARVAGEEQN